MGDGIGIGAKVGLLGRGAAGASVPPRERYIRRTTEAVYEPTEGAVTVSYPML
jgi:hypothetical protein